jgi:hypothetical protein
MTELGGEYVHGDLNLLIDQICQKVEDEMCRGL